MLPLLTLLLACDFEPAPADTSAGGTTDTAGCLKGLDAVDASAVTLSDLVIDGLALYAVPTELCVSDEGLDVSMTLVADDVVASIDVTLTEQGSFQMDAAQLERLLILVDGVAFEQGDLFAGAVTISEVDGAFFGSLEVEGTNASNNQLILNLSWSYEPSLF